MYGKTNVAGSGGGSFAESTDAVLKVLTSADATVTVTKNGTTKTGSDWVTSVDNSTTAHLYAIKQAQFDGSNAWQITSTRTVDEQTETITATIIINSNKIFEVSLLFTLPYEYQQVTYISSEGSGNLGNQYINTGILASSVKRGHVTGHVNSFGGNGQYASIFGANSCTASNKAIENYKTLAYVPKTGNYYVSSRTISATSLTAGNDFEVTFTVASESSSITVKNGTASAVTTTNTSSVGAIAAYPLFLFGCNYGGSFLSGYGFRGQISEAIFYGQNDEKLAHFIPCYLKTDATVIGMYDIVNGVFKANAGSGYLTKGSDVT